MRAIIYILAAFLLCHITHNAHTDCFEGMAADCMTCSQIAESDMTFMKPLCGCSGMFTYSLSSGRVTHVSYKRSMHDLHALRNARDKHFTPHMSCYYTSSIARFPSGTTEFTHHLMSLGKLVI